MKAFITLILFLSLDFIAFGQQNYTDTLVNTEKKDSNVATIAGKYTGSISADLLVKAGEIMLKNCPDCKVKSFEMIIRYRSFGDCDTLGPVIKFSKTNKLTHAMIKDLEHYPFDEIRCGKYLLVRFCNIEYEKSDGENLVANEIILHFTNSQKIKPIKWN